MYYKNLKSRDHIRLLLQKKKYIRDVFLPELICREYLDEIKKLDRNIIFYELDEHLNPNEENLVDLIKDIEVDKSVFLITDYFGISSLENIFRICKDNKLKVYIDGAISIKALHFAQDNNLDYSFSIYKHIGGYKGIYASCLENEINIEKRVYILEDILIWSLKFVLIFKRRREIFSYKNISIILREFNNLNYYFSYFIKNIQYNLNIFHNFILTFEKLIARIYIYSISKKLEVKNIEYKFKIKFCNSIMYGIPYWLNEEEYLKRVNEKYRIYPWPNSNNNKIKKSKLRLYFLPIVP